MSTNRAKRYECLLKAPDITPSNGNTGNTGNSSVCASPSLNKKRKAAGVLSSTPARSMMGAKANTDEDQGSRKDKGMNGAERVV